jgi:GNAT superfamily N-acetyltransferase
LRTEESKRPTYDRMWVVEIDPDGLWERQDLVAVAFGPDSGKPVGYFSFKVKVALNREQHAADLQIEPVLVYVSPRQRGNGYGIDLSIACAWICEDLLEAMYRAVPSGTSISGSVYADYESKGGEKIGQFIHDCISVKIDLLRDVGKRRSIDLIHFELDTDY